MKIYQSDCLEIEKSGDTLVQKWSEKILDVEDYRREMSKFLELFNKVKPKSLLWDNKNCTLILPEALDDWMGENILVPIYKKGLKKLVFTIPERTAVHLSIIKSLKKADSILQSIYFFDRNEAEQYLALNKNSLPEGEQPVWSCQLNDEKTSFNVNFNINPNDLPKILSYMEQVQVDNQFISLNQKNYESLTVQELKIFRLIALGNSNKLIAEKLFIEESSVKTHRKKIKKKLRIQTIFDIYQYARCYRLMDDSY